MKMKHLWWTGDPKGSRGVARRTAPRASAEKGFKTPRKRGRRTLNVLI